jgi:hypothetical protein
MFQQAGFPNTKGHRPNSICLTANFQIRAEPIARTRNARSLAQTP